LRKDLKLFLATGAAFLALLSLISCLSGCSFGHTTDVVVIGPSGEVETVFRDVEHIDQHLIGGIDFDCDHTHVHMAGSYAIIKDSPYRTP